MYAGGVIGPDRTGITRMFAGGASPSPTRFWGDWKMKRKGLILGGIAVLVVLMAGLGFAAWQRMQGDVVEGAGSSDHAQRPSEVLSYAGAEYPLKKDIDTLLVAGTDNYDNGSKEAFNNYAQTDFLVVLVFDNEAKTVSAIQLNRDTMCEVYRLDVLGKVYGTRREHLALAHTYGSGYADSCENVRRTVQTLLFEAPVDHYMVFTMEAVPIINDAVGGVQVTLEDDLTALKPGYTKGSTQTLWGKDALDFVRVRMAVGDSNNEARLGRHRAYMEGFLHAANAAAAKNSALGLEIYNACGDEVLTVLDANQISDVSKKLQEYTFTGIRYPDGTDAKGERFNEFTVDEASLWAIVKEAFCR